MFLNIIIAISGLKLIIYFQVKNLQEKINYIFWKHTDISEKLNIVAWLVVCLYTCLYLFLFFSQSCEEKEFLSVIPPLFYGETLGFSCTALGDKDKRLPQLPVFPLYLY